MSRAAASSRASEPSSERAEGVLVTLGRSFDEASLVHGHPSIRRDRPIALTGYGVADREKVSGRLGEPDRLDD